jgi:anaerobic ribonucleoside-triphosphate reductase
MKNIRICEICGHEEGEVSARFCEKCGAKLVPLNQRVEEISETQDQLVLAGSEE